MNILSDIIQFELPGQLSCAKPTELRNISRDEVRLLVTTGNGDVGHSYFRRFTDYLVAGDVLVVNTSATQPAAFPVKLPNNRKGMVHFSTQINDCEWLVEVREIIGNRVVRWKEGEENMVFQIPSKATIKLKRKFYADRKLLHLWVVEFNSGMDFQSYMNKYGQAIKYEDLEKSYPLDYYQTFFSSHPGSSEMPSAGRGFTQDLVNKLLQKGIAFAPILLHTGVSSLEENERPYPEYFEINPLSASVINNAKRNGGRVIAVGTTAVRAVETATNDSGKVLPYKGNTHLNITSNYRMKMVDSLLTGFHEPRASHLHMLQSLAGIQHIEKAYSVAVDNHYYWHQFGDLHLILP